MSEFRYIVRFLFVESSNKSEKGATLWKRFSSLQEMHFLLLTFYQSQQHHHIKDSFPTFPPVCINPFTDESSDAFLNGRRVELENYYRKLVGFQGIGGNAELLTFLQINNNT